MVDFGALNASVMAAFGETERVHYAPRDNSPPFDVNGVFDRYQVETMGEDGVPFSVKRSILGIRQADFPPGMVPRQGDRLLVQGLTFDVADVQPDTFGWVYLPLGMVG